MRIDREILRVCQPRSRAYANLQLGRHMSTLDSFRANPAPRSRYKLHTARGRRHTLLTVDIPQGPKDAIRALGEVMRVQG
jgi:hypothetical protein